MRNAEIEAWAIKAIDAVKSGRPVEGSRVELKATWIDDYGAARILAGHTNAAHNEPVLWIIGVDEKARKVTGADDTELSNWHSKVKSHFESNFAPVLDRVLPIPIDGQVVVALLFLSNRAPYLVKIEKNEGKHVVFWREGNSNRLARRDDMVRILLPISQTPRIEVLDCRVVRRRADGLLFVWDLDAMLYVIPRGPERVTIPHHMCRCHLDPRIGQFPLKSFSMKVNTVTFGMPSQLVQYQAIVTAPSPISVVARAVAPAATAEPPSDLIMSMTLGVAEADGESVTIEQELECQTSDGSSAEIVYRVLNPPFAGIL